MRAYVQYRGLKRARAKEKSMTNKAKDAVRGGTNKKTVGLAGGAGDERRMRARVRRDEGKGAACHSADKSGDFCRQFNQCVTAFPTERTDKPD